MTSVTLSPSPPSPSHDVRTNITTSNASSSSERIMTTVLAMGGVGVVVIICSILCLRKVVDFLRRKNRSKLDVRFRPSARRRDTEEGSSCSYSADNDEDISSRTQDSFLSMSTQSDASSRRLSQSPRPTRRCGTMEAMQSATPPPYSQFRVVTPRARLPPPPPGLPPMEAVPIPSDIDALAPSGSSCEPYSVELSPPLDIETFPSSGSTAQRHSYQTRARVHRANLAMDSTILSVLPQPGCNSMENADTNPMENSPFIETNDFNQRQQESVFSSVFAQLENIDPSIDPRGAGSHMRRFCTAPARLRKRIATNQPRAVWDIWEDGAVDSLSSQSSHPSPCRAAASLTSSVVASPREQQCGAAYSGYL